MKTKSGFNYAMVIIGVFLLFTSSYWDYTEVSLAAGFAFLMAGIYKLSQRTGESLESLTKKKHDESV
ncbi:hypothetical protein [Robiginitalea aurantiaca]|uniref:Uncharacterized protein n=1 Tax=Robiginitalea aurantiaca TaxID=3056915 RepID=A0ABT7WCX2_9FLAO|nr:hypothetical protein [Robiginitalea aurantiaca]MDM9630746.1 hypothetical protein [Robiginitalea aurantiaca]